MDIQKDINTVVVGQLPIIIENGFKSINNNHIEEDEPPTKRKVSEIWKIIDIHRPKDIPKFEWKRSYDGVKKALEFVKLTLITTEEDFDKISIPKDKKQLCYSHRKIVVSRKNFVFHPIRIDHLLSGLSTLRTKEELKIINDKKSENASIQHPKGSNITTEAETNSIDSLHDLIKLNEKLIHQHIIESRVSDVAYCFKDDDINSNVFFPIQVKTSNSGKKGRCKFDTNVEKMIEILERGMPLFCIGKTENVIKIVWVFYGESAIQMLKKYKPTLDFQPRLYLQRPTYNEFTLDHNNTIYRFDVGNSTEERVRLLDYMITMVSNGPKYTLQYLNEDFSQMRGQSYIVEQKSINMLRTACEMVNATLKRFVEDNYTVVDFRINEYIRVQNKATTSNDTKFFMRHKGCYPYNPNSIDIFLVSNIEEKIVYATQMRIIKNNEIVSNFTANELMECCLKITDKFEEFNLNHENDIRKYIEMCEKAFSTKELTDPDFYKKIIENNSEKFGSKRQLKERLNI